MKKKRQIRINMDDHRKAIGRGCTPQEYQERMGFDEDEARRQIGLLKSIPVITIGSDGKLRLLP